MNKLKPVFIAHRGYAAVYPENTLIAIDAAQQAGAKYVEVDIQLSADRVPLLFHDRDLQRLCQQPGAIHDYTFSQLKEFNVTNYEMFADKFSDIKITPLDVFIDYLKAHSKLYAFIELKCSMIETFGEESVIAIITPLFSEIKKQVSFISYNQNILKKIHSHTDYQTGVVVNKWEDYNKNEQWHPEWVFCSYDGLPENRSELAINSKVAVFEVSSVEVASELINDGVIYLETFRIKEMQKAFLHETH